MSSPVGRLSLGHVAATRRTERRTLQQVHDHEVGFYETDAYLTDTVVAHLGPALSGSDAAIVIATAAHRALFAAALEAEGIAVDAELESGRLVMLDAADTLDLFMSGDMPDPERFERVIGGVIDAAGGARHVRAYGEMVALLWDAGQVHAAIAL